MLPLVASITVWPGSQRAAALGVLDDAERQPVLDRAHRVERLDLDVQLTCAGASLLMRTTGVRPMVSRMLSKSGSHDLSSLWSTKPVGKTGQDAGAARTVRAGPVRMRGPGSADATL